MAFFLHALHTWSSTLIRLQLFYRPPKLTIHVLIYIIVHIALYTYNTY